MLSVVVWLLGAASVLAGVERVAAVEIAPVYGGKPVQPANSLLENGAVKVPDRDHFLRVQEQVIERLAKDGLI